MAKKAEGWLRRKMYADGETWLYCYYAIRPEDNKNVERSQRVGLVATFPSENDAWDEVEKLGYRKFIDKKLPVSPTFEELAAHWRKHDLGKSAGIGARAEETVETYESLLDGHVLPRWGRLKATEIFAPDVESWFDMLNTTPQRKVIPEGRARPKSYREKPLSWGSIQKLRTIMSLVFAHAFRHGLIPALPQSNPFRHPKREGGVRCKSTSDYEATIVTPEQMIDLLHALDEPESQMEWMMALLHAATALRGEEGFALKWSDFDWDKGLIRIRRAWSKGKQTKGKNEHSMTVAVMHPVLAACLKEWRDQSLYSQDADWVFPSLKLKGKKPRSASSAAQDHLRPAAIKAGIIEEGSAKRFGWHNLRHSLASFLCGVVDVAVTMKTLHHKRISTTTELYTHHVSEKQQVAQGLFLNAIRQAIPASKSLQ